MIIMKGAEAYKFTSGGFEPQLIANDILNPNGLADEFKRIGGRIGHHPILPDGAS
jgi:hypothetical protein